MAKETDQLIKEVASEIGWTQADIKRALEKFEGDGTKESITAACLLYAGSELKQRNNVIGGLKGANKRNKETIEDLMNQLRKVQDFYSQNFETMKATIREQSNYINELLKSISNKKES
jgi:predicted RNase H-like nuclease (RuvC/YqgF family)